MAAECLQLKPSLDPELQGYSTRGALFCGPFQWARSGWNVAEGATQPEEAEGPGLLAS